MVIRGKRGVADMSRSRRLVLVTPDRAAQVQVCPTPVLESVLVLAEPVSRAPPSVSTLARSTLPYVIISTPLFY